VPYLQELKAMDPIFMKYRIELDLKNYEVALKMIAQGGEKYFEEALALI
jgi:hypothetical protein